MNNEMIREKIRERIEQLKSKGLEKREHKYSNLFNECLVALNNNYRILSELESDAIYQEMQNTFPFTQWGRIDWTEVKRKEVVDDINDIVTILKSRICSENYTVSILWDSGDSPVIETDLVYLLNAVDDICAVSFDQWVFNVNEKYIIEFYHDGEITIGFCE